MLDVVMTTPELPIRRCPVRDEKYLMIKMTIKTTCIAMAFDRPDCTCDQGCVDSTLRPENSNNTYKKGLAKVLLLVTLLDV